MCKSVGWQYASKLISCNDNYCKAREYNFKLDNDNKFCRLICNCQQLDGFSRMFEWFARNKTVASCLRWSLFMILIDISTFIKTAFNILVHSTKQYYEFMQWNFIAFWNCILCKVRWKPQWYRVYESFLC